jgi:hypothetical protein
MRRAEPNLTEAWQELRLALDAEINRLPDKLAARQGRM